ncbi:hypothetical protein BaRGS_00006291, partial [Batillaria attramentaria]
MEMDCQTDLTFTPVLIASGSTQCQGFVVGRATNAAQALTAVNCLGPKRITRSSEILRPLVAAERGFGLNQSTRE